MDRRASKAIFVGIRAVGQGFHVKHRRISQHPGSVGIASMGAVGTSGARKKARLMALFAAERGDCAACLFCTWRLGARAMWDRGTPAALVLGSWVNIRRNCASARFYDRVLIANYQYCAQAGSGKGQGFTVSGIAAVHCSLLRLHRVSRETYSGVGESAWSAFHPVKGAGCSLAPLRSCT